jgi:gas vesicle structural protein
VTVQSTPGSAVERSRQSNLADVVGTILDKGVVVDVFARVSLVGIELLRADARVVIASVDTYLRFADAVNRLDMGAEEPRDLTEVVEDISETGAKGKAKGALEGGVDMLRSLVTSGDRDGEEAHGAGGKERPR